jgi:hypothetical protein
VRQHFIHFDESDQDSIDSLYLQLFELQRVLVIFAHIIQNIDMIETTHRDRIFWEIPE